MTTPKLDAIGLATADLPRAIAFYRALGCEIPDEIEGEGHVGFDLGGVRMMLDSEEVMRSFNPAWSAAGGGRVTLAARCGSPAEVDRLHDELSRLGSGSHLAPFDSFWGQRYATVLDPDGVHVDLYAELPRADA